MITPAQQVPPKQYGREVCTAVDEWQSNLKDAGKSLRSDLKGASNLSEGKDVFVNFLRTTVQETDTLLVQLREAGVPKVKDGDKVARAVESGFLDVRSLFVGAQETATNLSTTDPAQFQAGARDIQKALTNGADDIKRTFDRANASTRRPVAP